MFHVSKEDCSVFMFYVAGFLSPVLFLGFKGVVDMLVDSCRAYLLENVEIVCRVCRGKNLVKNGRSKRMFGGPVQNYRCKDCGSYVSENYFHEYYRHRYPVPVILLALQKRMEGHPVSKVVEFCAVPFLKLVFRPCYATITRWILKYGSKLVDRVSRIKLKASRRTHWEIDEQYDSRIVPAQTKTQNLKIDFSDETAFTITIGNKQLDVKISCESEYDITFTHTVFKNGKYVFKGKQKAGTIGIMDPETKLISLETFTHDLQRSANSLIRKTMYKWQATPCSIWSDGWTGYPLIMQTLDIPHGVVIHSKQWKSSRGHHDNNIEREWSTKREWIKPIRGFKSIKNRALYDKLYEIQRNFLTPHPTLNGQTPAQKAGHPHTTLIDLLKPTHPTTH